MALEELQEYEQEVGRAGMTTCERELLMMYEQQDAISDEVSSHTCIDGSDAPHIGLWIMIGCVMGYSLKWWNGRKGE